MSSLLPHPAAAAGGGLGGLMTGLGVPGQLLPASVKRRAAEVVAQYMGIELPPDASASQAAPLQPQAQAQGEAEAQADDGKPRKRSRWGSDTERVSHVVAALPPGLNRDQEEMYLAQLRVVELGELIRTGHVPRERSPEPEQVYNQQGVRLNTREVRYRLKHEKERHELVQKLLRSNPAYRPPPDYRPPDIKIEDHISIPQEEHPDINFMGLVIGPRGKTLQQLERETGAKVMIRGRLSLKEGKGKWRERGRGRGGWGRGVERKGWCRVFRF